MGSRGKPKHSFEGFNALTGKVRSGGIRTWSQVEGEFIRAVESFDQAYTKGAHSSGWYQSKARFFNDLVVAIIENSSAVTISTRTKKRSILFSAIDIDMCYPDTGDPIIAAEVKALGTPPHPGNNNTARSAHSDLHKRAREVAFTSTDIKAAYAAPIPIDSFKSWIDITRPGYFSFWAMRTSSGTDLSVVRSILSSLTSYCNGVGAVIYGLEPGSNSYRVSRYPELAMDRTIREITQRIVSSLKA